MSPNLVGIDLSTNSIHHPLLIDPDFIQNDLLLVPHPGHRIHHYIQPLLKKQLIHSDKLLKIESNDTALQLVIAGIGDTFTISGYEHTFPDPTTAPVYCHLDLPLLKRNSVVAYSANKQLNAMEKYMIEIAKSI